MNTFLDVRGVELWNIAGWTMLHFLWIGALIGVAAAISRWLLRRAAPAVRYTAALACLALLAAAPVVIATWLYQHAAPSSAAMITSLPTPRIAEQPAPIIELHQPEPTEVVPLASAPAPNLTPLPAVTPTPLPTPAPSILAALEIYIPYLPYLWITGAPLTLALLLTGVVGTKRLGRASQTIIDGPIAELLARLTTSLRITRRVTVAVCDRVASPVLIGIVRPIILLPPAALTGWSPDEIEMVLLHELAHVRRFDNLINLLQRIIESLLFFHPAVWLTSSWARRERETCCDTVVVTRTNRPHAYAELLVNLASQLSEQKSLPATYSAMAAGPLRSRIRHILQLEDDPMLVSGKSFAAMLASLVIIATLAVLYAPTIGQAEQSATEVTESTEKKQESNKAKTIEDAKQRAATLNNLKNISLALQNYHDQHKALPPQAKFDANGKPLLSWRVLILPLLGEEALFKEFNLDEPWNSEHNRKLLARIPAVFKNPRLYASDRTNYLAVVGNDCVFTGTPKPSQFKDITDGTSNTILIIEANGDRAVEWTKPQDWNFDRNQPTKDLGGLWPNFFNATWVDGSTRGVNLNKPADEIGILFTRNGGETKSLQESANRQPSGAEGATDVPAGPEGGPSVEPMPMRFELKSDADGKPVLSLNGTPVSDDALGKILESQGAMLENTPVSLSSDKGLKYSETMRIVNLLEAAGLKKLALSTRQVQPDDVYRGVLASSDDNKATDGKVAKKGTYIYSHATVDTAENRARSDWPRGVAFPSPKEGDIATRAWRELGIKVVAATAAEQAAENGQPLKVVGGAVGLPGTPLFLTGLNDIATPSFDALAAAIDKVKSQPIIVAKCVTTSGDGPLRIDTLLGESELPKFDASPKHTLAPANAVQPNAGNAPALAVATDGNNVDPKSELAVVSSGTDAATTQKATQPAPQEQIVATFPLDVVNSDPTQLLNAYKNAKKQSLYVDLKRQGDQYALVLAPIPTEADWPAILGEPPRKERVIAEKAWQRLGLKLAPQNTVEALERQMNGHVSGVKIVGGNVPVGLPLPAVLTSVGTQSLSSFDELLVWLESEQGRSGAAVKCYANVDDKEFLFEAGSISKPESTAPTQTPRSSYAAPTQPAKPRASFPSFEDQKLADLAYQRLNLELEPVASDDLKRVKALGYEGAVKVVQKGPPTSMQIAASQNTPMQIGDLLVGLHAWPTTSMQDVAKILNRDDLAELNPLKFYVVRQKWENPAGAKPIAAGDELITGRVLVQTSAGAHSKNSYKTRPQNSTKDQELNLAPQPAAQGWIEAAPAANAQSNSALPRNRQVLEDRGNSNDSWNSDPWKSSSVQPTQILPTQTTAVPTSQPSTQTVIRPRSLSDGRTVYESFSENVATTLPAQTTVRAADAYDPNAQSSGTLNVYSALPAASAAAPHLPTPGSARSQLNQLTQVLPAPTTSAPSVSQPANRTTRLARDANDVQDVYQASSALAPVTATDSAKANLRYDGKTFEQWRNTWSTELSTTKRLEAIRALAAFGRAGYGKEAAATILDVAGQYEFVIIDGSDEGKLKQTVLDELTPLSPDAAFKAQPLAKYWVSDLAARLEKDPKNWRSLAVFLLSRLQTDDEPTLAIVRKQAASGDGEVRSTALNALVYSRQSLTGGPQLDDKTRQLVDEALQSKDTAIVRSALQLLLYAPPNVEDFRGGGYGGGVAPPPQLRYRPEMLSSLLFHADEGIRRQTRDTLPLLDTQVAAQVADQLLAVLKDKSRKRDHVEAMRALAIMGNKAAKANRVLLEMVKSADDQATLAAAIVATIRCAGKQPTVEKDGARQLNGDVFDEVIVGKLSGEERNSLENVLGESNEASAKRMLDFVIQEESTLLPPNNQNVGGGGFF